MPKTLENVEIFAVGTWNGMKFTTDDLKEIEVNTNALLKNKNHKPPLKLGHSEAQILQGQDDGDPALGWMENIRAEGDKLFADFVDVPDVVAKAIEAKLFKQVSVEMRHLEHIGWVLQATAILGADLPAVKSLEDLSAYLSDNLTGIPLDKNALFSSIEPVIIGETKMTEETKDFSEENKVLTEKLAKLEAENQKFKAQEFELKFSVKKEEILAQYKEDVKAGKLQPAILDKIEACLDEQKAQFSDGHELRFNAELTSDIVKAYSSPLPTGEKASDEKPETLRADEEIEKKISVLMSETSLDYQEASDRVFKANPELAKAYRDLTVAVSNGEEV